MLTRTSVSSPCVVVPTIHTHPHVEVRYWHKADIEREVRKGRFYRETDIPCAGLRLQAIVSR